MFFGRPAKDPIIRFEHFRMIENLPGSSAHFPTDGAGDLAPIPTSSSSYLRVRPPLSSNRITHDDVQASKKGVGARQF